MQDRVNRLAVRTVADDLFSASAGDDVDGAGERREVSRLVRCGLPHKDALRAGPLLGDGGGGFEDGWSVGEETAVPEVGAAAFEDVDVVSLQVETERGTGFVFAVDGDEVFGMDLRRYLFRELRGGEDRSEGLETEVGGEEEAEGSGGECEGRGVGLRFFSQDKRCEWADEKAKRGDGEGEPEEAEGLGVEVEEVAHAEGVVAGVLGEEGGEIRITGRGFGVEEEVGGGDGEEGTEGEEDVQ